MPKILVIVESPAKAKTIERFLGSGYKVMASRGHLRDLPRNQFGVNIEEGFVPTYTNMWDKRKLIDDLQEEYVRSKKVFLATDPDREGEAISLAFGPFVGYRSEGQVPHHVPRNHEKSDF